MDVDINNLQSNIDNRTFDTDVKGQLINALLDFRVKLSIEKEISPTIKVKKLRKLVEDTKGKYNEFVKKQFDKIVTEIIDQELNKVFINSSLNIGHKIYNINNDNPVNGNLIRFENYKNEGNGNAKVKRGYFNSRPEERKDAA